MKKLIPVLFLVLTISGCSSELKKFCDEQAPIGKKTADQIAAAVTGACVAAEAQ